MAPQWRPNSASPPMKLMAPAMIAAGALGHHQHDLVGHALADQRVELAGQVGPAPFARAGLHVELEEGVPGLFGQVLAGEPVHGDAGGQRVAPLALDGLALAGRQRLEERVEGGVAVVLPMELLVGAMQEAVADQRLAFRLRQEGEMDRGGLALAAEFEQAGDQPAAHPVGLRRRADQEPPAGRWRERHRDLELGVVLAASPLVGLGPAAVEDVFAPRVRFQIAGHHADEGAVRGLGQQMLRLPAGSRRGRAGGLQGMTENHVK